MRTQRPSPTLSFLLVAATTLAVCGCTSTSQPHPGDPFEGTNRAMYGVQTTVVDGVLDPVAKGYRAVIPEPGRDAVRNLLGNLKRPTGFVNHILQGDPMEALSSATAFVIDTTVGLAGTWRPSARMGVADEQVGFADTLTSWGFCRGPYVVLPLLGAGVTRNIVGRVVDSVADPTRLVLSDGVRLALSGATVLDVRERTVDRREQIEDTEDDPYAAVRARFLEEGARDEDRARWVR